MTSVNAAPAVVGAALAEAGSAIATTSAPSTGSIPLAMVTILAMIGRRKQTIRSEWYG